MVSSIVHASTAIWNGFCRKNLAYKWLSYSWNLYLGIHKFMQVDLRYESHTGQSKMHIYSTIATVIHMEAMQSASLNHQGAFVYIGFDEHSGFVL